MTHIDAPNRMIEYFREEGYNSRRSSRSPIFAKYVLQDVLHRNPKLRDLAEDGEVVYFTNHSFTDGGKPANIVLGPIDRSEPPSGTDEDFEYSITEKYPNEIWLAIRITALMTQLGRNVSNRRGGLQSMAQEAHTANADTVSAGLMITTIADEVRFNHHDEIQTTGLGTEAVSTVVDKLSETTTSQEGNPANIDGLALIVFDYDGMSDPERYETKPSPYPGTKLYYESFVENICDLIDFRFLGLPDAQSADVTEFIERGEGRTIEFKREIPNPPKKIAREVVAFLNTDGGAIIIGVEDDGTVSGVNDINFAQQRVTNILRDYIAEAPEYQIDTETINGEDLIVIRVPRDRQRLYGFEGSFLIRYGESNRTMRFEEIKRFVTNQIVDYHRLDELVND